MADVQDFEPKATLLVVDDDEAIRSLVSRTLGARGYRVLTAANVVEMRRVLQASERIDVVILDIMMPGEDGLSACRRLEETGGPPVILLSALGEEADRILGLESGADHYLPKPCGAREILAHVHAVLRRQRKSAGEDRTEVRFLGYRVDLDAQEVFNAEGARVDISAGQYAILRVFLSRPRRVLTRDELLLAARGSDTEAFNRAVDVQVSRLRRKLKVDDHDLIRTVRNEGYMFMPKVTVLK
ncbi:response regulator [Xanthobacter autotrophicus]|nr:response regulator [Xanthobacter autotrophicus]